MKYIIAFLLLSSVSYGKDFRVKHLKGDVMVAGEKEAPQKIKNGDEIPGLKVISSDSADFEVTLINDFSSIRLKGKFKLKLPATEAPKQTIDLIYGSLRATIVKQKNDRLPIEFKTPSAVAGVRGTDFIFIYTPLLGESEILCFDGLIDFGSEDRSTSQMVSKGQWGGHGGRFGSKIAKPLDLPQNVLSYFNQQLPPP